MSAPLRNRASHNPSEEKVKKGCGLATGELPGAHTGHMPTRTDIWEGRKRMFDSHGDKEFCSQTYTSLLSQSKARLYAPCLWFTCLSDFEDKESHRSIFLLYSPIFLFPNLQFTGGFRSARDTMSVFLVTFLFKQSKGGQNLAHYLSLWAVCLCLITLAQTRTFFFFKWKSLSLLAPPFFVFILL